MVPSGYNNSVIFHKPYYFSGEKALISLVTNGFAFLVYWAEYFLLTSDL